MIRRTSHAAGWEGCVRGMLAKACGLIVLLACVGAAMPAVAQQMSFNVLTDRAGCGNCTWLQASGEITADTTSKFKSFLQEHPYVSVVQIDSVGGNLGAALEMGELVRSRNLAVVVGGATVRSSSSGDQIATRVAGQCMSACVYLLAAGQPRSQVLDSTIGVHQFYGGTSNVTGDVGLDTGQRISGALIDYLTRMGVSPSMITAASSARPDEIYILSNTEKLRFKLLTSVQEQYSAAPGYGRAVGVTSTGIDPFGDNDRVPPASTDECGKARFSLAEAGSVSAMQSKNRFFRDVCEEYFRIIGISKLTECQDAWNDAYQVLEGKDTGSSLPHDMQLNFLSMKMLSSSTSCSQRRYEAQGGKQRY